MKNSILFLLLTFSAIISSSAFAMDLPDDSIYNANSKWTDQNNKSVQLKDFKDKYVVTSMVYLSCKFSCPLTIAKMKEVEKGLSPDLLKKVQFVIISFDFKHDTPVETLKYANKNHLDISRWIFLTNKNENTIREYSTLIDFKYKTLPNGDYDHSFALVALNTQGKILGRTDGSEMNPKVIIDLIKSDSEKIKN